MEKMAKVHVLKTWPEHFRAVVEPDPNKRKTVEIRKNDRDFQVGDVLLLKEFIPNTGEFTGSETGRLVTHILKGDPWLPEGYVALSIAELSEQPKESTSETREEEKTPLVLLNIDGKRVELETFLGAPDETGVLVIFNGEITFEDPDIIEKFKNEETGWEWVDYREWFAKLGRPVEMPPAFDQNAAS